MAGERHHRELKPVHGLRRRPGAYHVNLLRISELGFPLQETSFESEHRSPPEDEEWQELRVSPPFYCGARAFVDEHFLGTCYIRKYRLHLHVNQRGRDLNARPHVSYKPDLRRISSLNRRRRERCCGWMNSRNERVVYRLQSAPATTTRRFNPPFGRRSPLRPW